MALWTKKTSPEFVLQTWKNCEWQLIYIQATNYGMSTEGCLKVSCANSQHLCRYYPNFQCTCLSCVSLCSVGELELIYEPHLHHYNLHSALCSLFFSGPKNTFSFPWQQNNVSPKFWERGWPEIVHKWAQKGWGNMWHGNEFNFSRLNFRCMGGIWI